MVLNTLKEKKDFTYSECVLSDYILNHIDEMYDMRVEELAVATYTSKATVVRFCKKVTNGKGYHEFKLLLMSEIMQIREMNRKNRDIIQNFSNYDIKEVIQELYYIAETSARLVFNEQSISNLTNRIMNADFIDLFGTGLDSCYARETAYKFRRLEIFATALDDLYEYDINEKNKKKIAMVFGIQKPLSYVQRLAEELKVREYYVISFFDGEEEKPVDRFLGDILFAIKTDIALTESLKIIFYEIVLKYIVDVIIGSVEKKRHVKQKLQNQ